MTANLTHNETINFAHFCPFLPKVPPFLKILFCPYGQIWANMGKKKGDFPPEEEKMLIRMIMERMLII